MLRHLTAAVLCSAAFAQDYFSAALNGAQEVPPVPTAGRGWGIVRFEPATNNVRIFVHYEGLTGAPVAAHLHQGAVGASGGILVGLSPVGANQYTGTGTLTAAGAALLTAGNTYLNVHTPAFGGGEIRGQVVPATSTRFTGLLSGAQEVPPVPTAASGRVIAFLHEPEGRVVYDVDSTGLANVIKAHMHDGPAGVNGPVIFTLNGTAGNYTGVSNRLTAAQVATMKANGMYMNVHTNAFATGELRAQLIRDAGDHWVAALDGASEVPPVATAGLGGAQLLVAPDNTITLTGAYNGLVAAAIAAHVHLGAPGANGPIVFPLTFAGGTLSGSHVPSAADLTNLRAGNWYVNVHTTAFGGGEIRGQLVPAKLPAPYGEGCPGSNGVRPQSGATGFASVGSSMSIDLYGALPGGIALFAFGTSRDTASGAIPLPIELPVVGLASPNCYLLADPVVLLVAIADPFGFATQPFGLPFAPSLRGLNLYTQWVTLDPAATPSGFVTSSALGILIQ